MNILSRKGAQFIAAHEGFVSKAYRDPVGVLTIGTGFTNRSKAFKAYWVKKHDRGLRPGDTITRAENDKILQAVVAEEYGAAVNRDISPNLKQHQFDGCASVLFNLGPGATKWRWAQAIKKGFIARGCKLLANGYNKAGGRTLAGLVKRRRAEAALIENGTYGGLKQKATNTIDLEAYQRKLKRLGYDVGPIDGENGPLTEAAVLAFQKNHPNLENDGILGRATAAQIDRRIKAIKAGKKTTPAIVGGGGAAVVLDQAVDWSVWAQGATLLTLLAVIGFLAWRYRDEIRHFIKDWFNGEKDEVAV